MENVVDSSQKVSRAESPEKHTEITKIDLNCQKPSETTEKRAPVQTSETPPIQPAAGPKQVMLDLSSHVKNQKQKDLQKECKVQAE